MIYQKPFIHIFHYYSVKGFLSIDIDVSELQVNQCNSPRFKENNQNQPLTANKYYDEIFSQIEIFHDSNKCHPYSMLVCSSALLHSALLDCDLKR